MQAVKAGTYSKEIREVSGNVSESSKNTLVEGSAAIIFESEGEAFYNKVQVFNRDLSVLVISLFQEQRRLELLQQSQQKAGKKSWRQLTPTVDHWGTCSLNDLDSNKMLVPSAKPLRVLEALSATGLRSIRYIKEIPGEKYVVINDIDAAAVRAIERNLRHNNIGKGLYRVSQEDAAKLMFENRTEEKRFDVIDLDPYGSPSVFIDAAIQSITNGGLLAITCTDLSVLCGSHKDSCYSKYGSVPLKAPYCHEMALRIVLADLNRQAARYKRYIVPLYCVRVDFYVRLFVRVYESARECRLSSCKLSNVYQCSQCDSFSLQPLGQINKKNQHSMPARGPCIGPICEYCGGKHSIGGPIWNRPMLNRAFGKAILHCLSEVDKKIKYTPGFKSDKSVEKSETETFLSFLTTGRRIKAEIIKALGEVENTPLFWSLSSICKTLRCIAPSLTKVQTALINAGYKVSQSATNPDSIKTDAPAEVMWDIFREWTILSPVKRSKKLVNFPCAKILRMKTKTVVDFETGSSEVKANRKRERLGVTRYQMNPEKFWGPKSRAAGSMRERKRQKF